MNQNYYLLQQNICNELWGDAAPWRYFVWLEMSSIGNVIYMTDVYLPECDLDGNDFNSDANRAPGGNQQ
jgi:hypothetical protein